MEEINREDMSSLPSGSHIAYHLTDKRNISSIANTGILCNYSSDKWDTVNEFLNLIAEDEGFNSVPNKRRNCVFAYSRLRDGLDFYNNENCLFVIDISKVKCPVYRGSYHKVTKVHDILLHKSLLSAEEVIDSAVFDEQSKEACELAISYWESIERISKSGTDKGGELLIDGDVKPQSITHFVR